MALVVAQLVADGQIFNMAVAAFAQGLDVLQRGGSVQHMLTADPTGHHAMQLACHGFVDFVAGEGESAHGSILIACPVLSLRSAPCPSPLSAWLDSHVLYFFIQDDFGRL